jgi:hypothetical protein
MIRKEQTVKIVNKALSYSLLIIFVASMGYPGNSGKLPILPGSKDKPCGENEENVCRETPTSRMAYASSAGIDEVARQLLVLSKKQSWKMVKVTGCAGPRYQSSNAQGFFLLWDVERETTLINSTADKKKTNYNIYYWKIYGE